jgi:hypothetical protein
MSINIEDESDIPEGVGSIHHYRRSATPKEAEQRRMVTDINLDDSPPRSIIDSAYRALLKGNVPPILYARNGRSVRIRINGDGTDLPSIQIVDDKIAHYYLVQYINFRRGGKFVRLQLHWRKTYLHASQYENLE